MLEKNHTRMYNLWDFDYSFSMNCSWLHGFECTSGPSEGRRRGPAWGCEEILFRFSLQKGTVNGT